MSKGECHKPLVTSKQVFYAIKKGLQWQPFFCVTGLFKQMGIKFVTEFFDLGTYVMTIVVGDPMINRGAFNHCNAEVF